MATAKTASKVAKKATAKKTAAATTPAELHDAAPVAKKTVKKAAAKKAAPKKAAKKGVVVVKEVRAPKPVKPGIPAKPKKAKTAAVATAANISLTVLELEARINAVEGVGATPRLIVLRRPADAIMNSIGVQNSAYTNDARPALPSRTLDALNARLGALNLRPTEWFIRNLY